MSEHFLHLAHVGTAIQKVGGRGMTKRMRTDVWDMRHFGMSVDELPYLALTDASTLCAKECGVGIKPSAACLFQYL